MKTVLRSFALFIAINAMVLTTAQKVEAQVSVSFQIFYDNLSPYGRWINNPDYGYVWVPRVSHGFRPYGTNGYWILTDDGWTWASNYSWGWAPFHYGRWFYDSYYGWVWVPDNEWGPGWVSWRRSDDYYGWAPIAPGISIDIAYSNSYSLPYDRWTFVRNRDFGRTNITNYYVSNTNNVTIINNTAPLVNTRQDRTGSVRYNAGPDRTEVERRAGRSFTPVSVKDNTRPGQTVNSKELRIYKPQVEKSSAFDRRPAPAKVENMRTTKPVEQNRNDQPVKQPVNQNRNNPSVKQPVQENRMPPVKQQPVEQKRNDQPARVPPGQQKQNDQPAKQPMQENRMPPVKQQPVEQKRNNPPAKQPVQENRMPPVKQQPVEQKRNDQPAKQPMQENRTPPVRQQPVEQKRNDQPARTPPGQQKQNDQPAKQPPAQKKKNG